MNSFFLTEPEKERIKTWRYRALDNSVSTKLLTPFWNWCLEWIPEEIAPNILTLAGLLCLFQSTYLTYYKYEQSPFLIGCLNICLIFGYQTLDALDGKQARRIKNSSPVGELFDHACDSIGLICIVITMCTTFRIHNPWTQWLLVNLAEIIFMTEHLETLVRDDQKVEFSRWTGPGEALLACLGLIALNLFFPLGDCVSNLLALFGLEKGLVILDLLLGIGLGVAISRAIGIAGFRARYSTRNGVWLCFFFHFLTAYLTYDLHNLEWSQYQYQLISMDVLCDGLFWAILSGDLTLCKMAGRDLHPAIVLFSMASLLNNWLIPVFLVGYYISVFTSLLEYCHIPMFSCVRTCYVNGVFDMGHYNHMEMFQKALEVSKCNRLIVGVMSDADVKKHKGPLRPVDSIEDRVAFVERCKAVSEVVPNAPWDDVPEDFIKDYGIHIVAHSEEYSPSAEDYCYKTPWSMGIVRLVPRGKGMSTSYRIAQVKNKHLENKPDLLHCDDDGEFGILPDHNVTMGTGRKKKKLQYF